LPLSSIPSLGILKTWTSGSRHQEENSKRVFNALAKFGAPLQGLTSQDFAQEGFFFQVGLPPARIDILMSLPGLSFDDSSSKKGTTLLWGVTVPILSIEDLIANKSAVGRDQDLADVKSLQRALKNKLTRAI